MDITLLIALASIILMLIISLVLFLKPSVSTEERKEPRNRNAPRAQQNANVPRRIQAIRNQRARLRTNVQESDEEAEAQEERPNLNIPDDANIGAKKRAKLEAKAERKAQREIEERTREERKKREQLAEEERKKASEKAEAEEKQREEEEKRAREEQERKENEEYLKMKEAFSVEEEGFEEGDNVDEENVLQQFVSHIKNNKVVILEDLASQFKLKTQAVIDRIQDLQQSSILTGVIDDRGKFIYISQEELQAVAKFIKQRGRVSISELAENSNQLITLTPQIPV